MTKFAIMGFSVVGALLWCTFCESAASDLGGECSDATASGVCPKRGKSMLQMSSSVAAVHSEESPNLAPAQRGSNHSNDDWALIDAQYGCQENDDGIKLTSSGTVHSLEACMGKCLLDLQCRAIDFMNWSGYCATFNQPCETPKAWWGSSSYAFHARISKDQCNMVKMIHKYTFEEIPLRPRASPVRVVDFSQIAFESELPILRLRLREMGPYVDEFHIAEGNHDFSGRPKKYLLQSLLAYPDVAKWRHKVVHHKVNTSGAQVDTVWEAREIFGSGVLLEGDLDEIMSRTFLSTIKHCEPALSDWVASVQMPFLQWNMGWAQCGTCTWWDATIAHDIGIGVASRWGYFFNQMPVEERVEANSSYIKSTDYLLVQLDGRPAGWHVSWTLNGAKGLANKYLYGWNQGGWKGDVPKYLEPYMGNETKLAEFLEQFLENPATYDSAITPSTLTVRDLPESVVEDPDMFKVQLGSRLYDMVKRLKL